MMRSLLLTVASVWAFLAPASGQDAPAVGMLLEVTGQTQIERSGSENIGQLADLLYVGDKVVVDSGNVTFMFCPSGQRISLENGAVAELGARGIATTGPDPASSAMDCILPEVALGTESLEHIGSFQPRTIYDAIPLYTGGRISKSRPVFRWKEVGGVDSYELRLTNVAGVGVWTYRTEVNSAPYPESMRPLSDGAYTWELTAENRGQIMFQERTDFTVDTPGTDFEESLEEFRNSILRVFGIDDDESPEPTGEKLTGAIRLENAGYYSEAAELYRQLRDQHPDGRITRRLVWLYSEAGLAAAADDELSELQ